MLKSKFFSNRVVKFLMNSWVLAALFGTSAMLGLSSGSLLFALLDAFCCGLWLAVGLSEKFSKIENLNL